MSIMIIVITLIITIIITNTYLPNSTPSEIDGGLFLAAFTGSDGKYIFHISG